MKLILLGAPGAGKGTQAAKLAKEFNIPTISTGYIIRKEIAEKTPVGIEAKGYIDRGELVPDSMVVEMVKERIKDDDCKNGYILDGFPRTVSQAEIMETIPIKVDLVVEICVDENIIVDRLTGRRECKKCGASYHITNNPPKVSGVCDVCGDSLKKRDDDVPEIIRNRIKAYHELTEPLKSFYQKKNLLISIEGCDEVEDTSKAVLKAVRERIDEAKV